MNKINGLTYLDDFLTVEEEKQLLEKINSFEWSNKLSRKTQHYGYLYDYSNPKKEKTTPIPDCFDSIINKLNTIYNIHPDQLIINEYKPGQFISPHIDNIQLFEDNIASISLGSECTIQFINQNDIYKIVAERRSIIILSGDSRYNYTHEIIKNSNSGIRVSLTFRKMK